MIIKTAYQSKPKYGAKPNKAARKKLGIAVAWLFNENCGIDVFDPERELTASLLYNAAFTHNGKFGHAIEFDGSSDHVKCDSDYIDLKITGPLSIITWVRLTNDKNAMECIVAKGGAWSANNSFSLTWNTGNNNIWFYLRKGDNSASVWAFYPKNYDEEWHCIIGVFDGTKGKVYVDGVKGTDSAAITSIFNSTQVVRFGGIGTSYNLQGLIDHVIICNHALTEDEVQRVYNRPFYMYDRPPDPLYHVSAAPPPAIQSWMDLTTMYWTVRKANGLFTRL